MPRGRFTVKGMMVAVALVAAILGLLVERRARFRRIALAHKAERINLRLSDLDVYLIVPRTRRPASATSRWSTSGAT